MFVLGCVAAAEPVQPAKRILYVCSNNVPYHLNNDIADGIRSHLRDIEFPIKIDTIELRAEINDKYQFYIANYSELNNVLKSSQYDLIVGVDNLAVDLLLTLAADLQLNIPIVFAHYTVYNQKFNQKYINSTGLTTDYKIQENIKLACRLFPNTQHITVLNSSSQEAGYLQDIMRKNTAPDTSVPPLHFITSDIYSTDEMLAQLATLPEDSVVLFNSWKNQHDFANNSSSIIYDSIVTESPGPIFSTDYDLFNSNALGGVLIKGDVHGQEIAELIYRILDKNIHAADIPVQPGKNELMVNYKMLKHWQLKIKDFPSNTMFTQYSPSIFTTYRREISIALFMFGLIALAAAIFLYRAKLAARRLKTILSELPIHSAAVDKNGKVLFVQCDMEFNSKYNRQLNTIDDFPTEIVPILKNKIEDTLKNGTRSSVEFNLFGHRRKASFCRLPRETFGSPTVLWISTDVSDLHLARQTAQSSVEKLHATLSAIADGIIATDAQGKVTLFNHALTELLQVPANQIQSSNIDDLIKLTNPENGEPIPPPIDTAIKDKICVNVDSVQLNLSADKQIYVDISAAPIKDFHQKISGAVMTVRDLTELRHKELAKNNTRTMLQKVLDNLPVFACVATKSGDEFRYVYWNKICVENTGISGSDAIGKTDAELNRPPEIIAYNLDIYTKAWNGELTVFEEDYATIGNGMRKLQTFFRKIELPGAAALLLRMSIDITNETRLHNSLKNYSAQQKVIAGCLELLLAVDTQLNAEQRKRIGDILSKPITEEQLQIILAELDALTKP